MLRVTGGPARVQNRGPAEVPLGLARWRPRTRLVTCARGMSRAPVSGHAQIATPGVSPRKEKDSGGVGGAVVASQDLSRLFHVCCTPRAVSFDHGLGRFLPRRQMGGSAHLFLASPFAGDAGTDRCRPPQSRGPGRCRWQNPESLTFRIH